MVDYARTQPSELAPALAVLSQWQGEAGARGGFQGGLLVLDGCCYVADLAHLERRLLQCGGDCGTGGAFPIVVAFDGNAPAVASDDAVQVRWCLD